ncbi:hypothetical protein PQQ99_20100 [Paraburkholderia sediminicola]|uniref:hypothetical protein n=1 Tax=Paraburkholderia sediminicola TaxID=458836 RepID=UPI0038BBC2D7
MDKFFSKDLADQIGYGTAIQVAAASSELQTDLARMAAIRKAQGKPSFAEEEAADKAEFRRMIEAGEGDDLDPDVRAWALED